MGTMHPLVKRRTAVLVIIAEKSRSQWTMCVQTGMKTNMLHLHDPYTPTYMEALSGENSEEYFKAMNGEIQSLTRRDTWDIVLRD